MKGYTPVTEEDSDSESTHSSSSEEKNVLPTQQDPKWKALLSCLIYSATSISMVLANKTILTGFQFQFDFALLFFQNSTSVVLLLLGQSLGWVTFERLELRKALNWLPLNVFFVLMLLTGFYSLALLSVPMMTIFKNSSNLLVTVGDYILYGQTVTRGVLACLAIMIGAAFFAALNDITLDRTGIMWALLNSVVSAGYVLYMPRAMESTQLSSFGKVFYNSTLSLPLIVLLDALTSRDFVQLYTTPATSKFINLPFLSTVVFSGLVGFSISLASFNCVRATSPTTYSMVGSMNKIPLSIIGVVLFRTQLTFNSVVFISLSLVAGILYAYTKSLHAASKDHPPLKDHPPMRQPDAINHFKPTPASLEHRNHQHRQLVTMEKV